LKQTVTCDGAATTHRSVVAHGRRDPMCYAIGYDPDAKGRRTFALPRIDESGADVDQIHGAQGTG
jgi:hypothetical protein